MNSRMEMEAGPVEEPISSGNVVYGEQQRGTQHERDGEGRSRLGAEVARLETNFDAHSSTSNGSTLPPSDSSNLEDI